MASVWDSVEVKPNGTRDCAVGGEPLVGPVALHNYETTVWTEMVDVYWITRTSKLLRHGVWLAENPIVPVSVHVLGNRVWALSTKSVRWNYWAQKCAVIHCQKNDISGRSFSLDSIKPVFE